MLVLRSLATTLILATGCSAGAGTGAGGGSPPPLTTTAPEPPGAPASVANPPPVPLVVVEGAGWTSSGLSGPPYAGEHCHYRFARVSGVEEPLPDPACTPGAVDATVTQADLDGTICRRGGYTSLVRPPESVTEPAKREAMASYSAPGATSGYEFDHLVPLGLGGASTTTNLWPELDIGGHGAYVQNTKDQVEDDLHQAVCDGRTSLGAAQRAIATDWTTAEASLGAPLDGTE